MKSKLSILLLGIAGWFASQPANACTGITLKSKDGTTIVARTIEWGGSNLNSQYVIVPRGYTAQSYTPEGINGMKFTARYGYVGLAVEQKEFIAEGVNEAGLSAGLFYFPSYGKYEDYNASEKENTISDLQLVSWILGNCATLDEVKEAVKSVHVVNIDPRSSTVHWRFTDAEGKQLVLEITEQTPHFFENTLGVLTNSPGFEWQLTNLNNYPEKRKVLTSGGALRDQIIDAFVNGELIRWKTELISRIIPENRALISKFKEIKSAYVTDEDSYNWNKLNRIRYYLAKDSIDQKSLFTQLIKALNSGDFATASSLQVEMYDKMEELKTLYAAYKDNMI